MIISHDKTSDLNLIKDNNMKLIFILYINLNGYYHNFIISLIKLYLKYINRNILRKNFNMMIIMKYLYSERLPSNSQRSNRPIIKFNGQQLDNQHDNLFKISQQPSLKQTIQEFNDCVNKVPPLITEIINYDALYQQNYPFNQELMEQHIVERRTNFNAKSCLMNDLKSLFITPDQKVNLSASILSNEKPNRLYYKGLSIGFLIDIEQIKIHNGLVDGLNTYNGKHNAPKLIYNKTLQKYKCVNKITSRNRKDKKYKSYDNNHKGYELLSTNNQYIGEIDDNEVILQRMQRSYNKSYRTNKDLNAQKVTEVTFLPKDNNMSYAQAILFVCRTDDTFANEEEFINYFKNDINIQKIYNNDVWNIAKQINKPILILYHLSPTSRDLLLDPTLI